MRSKGWDIPKIKNKTTGKLEQGNIIYVLGTVDGKFYRKPTGKEANKLNIAWISKNARDVLLKLIDKQESKKEFKPTLESYGLKVIEATSRFRSINNQKDKLAYFKNHLLPYFKARNIVYLEDIKTTEIEIWQNFMLKKYSASTTKKCKDTLGLIMQKAVADDLLSKNYVMFSDKISLTSAKKRVPYTPGEVTTLLKQSDGWFKTFLYLIFSTGVRTGEALALMWEDIDFENGFIDLKRSISKARVTTKDGNCTIDEFIANGYKIKNFNNTNKTKNHTRLIPLDNITRDILVKHFEQRTQDKWIFVNKNNICYTDASTINRRYWKPLLNLTKIEDKDLYTSRHTYVSIMKNNGADESWLKSVGGWTQSSKVLNDHYFTFQSSKEDIKKANNFFYNLEKKEAK